MSHHEEEMRTQVKTLLDGAAEEIGDSRRTNREMHGVRLASIALAPLLGVLGLIAVGLSEIADELRATRRGE